MPGCPILSDIPTSPKYCHTFIDMVLSYVQAHPNIKTVILASRWATYAEGTHYKVEASDRRHIYPNLSNTPDAAQKAIYAKLFKSGLNKMVRKVLNMGRKVVIVSQIPEIGYDVPAAFSIAGRTGRNVNKIISPTLNEYMNRNKLVIPVLESLAKKENVQIVDPWKVLCKQGICRVAINGVPLYDDDDHLSNPGAQYIASIFDAVFENPTAQ
jgi:hypothetical protein